MKIALTVLEFLSTTHEKGNQEISTKTFLEFTWKWLELNNRGGLIVFNDKMYMFIRRIEVVRKVLTITFLKTYKDEDIRDLLLCELQNSNFITKMWNSLAKDIRNDTLSFHIRDEILTIMIDIRAQAFVNTFFSTSLFWIQAKCCRVMVEWLSREKYL